MTFLFPGSFDPPTKGHENIIKRVSALSDVLYVGVLVNVKKKYKYSAETRKAMLEKITENMPNVTVEIFDGLLVDAVKQCGADAIVKGIRNVTDYMYEADMAVINYDIAGIETFYIQAAPEKSTVSSSVVRELQAFNSDVSKYVPECIIDML